uniref:achaete-scute homolog 2-like n=1 Tax=Myxine glutinosa TaxID=7769 RepID=UPI00358E8293
MAQVGSTHGQQQQLFCVVIAQEGHENQGSGSGSEPPVCPPSPRLLRCRRRVTATYGARGATARRNERERNRVRLVNQGFAVLQEHVPDGDPSRRLSKVETLRAAAQYISSLQTILAEHDADVDVSTSDSPRPPSWCLGPPSGLPTRTSLSPRTSVDIAWSAGSSVSGSCSDGSCEALGPEELDFWDLASWF